MREWTVSQGYWKGLTINFTCKIISLPLIYLITSTQEREPDSSVSIVFGYGLDDRAIDVRSPEEARGLFL
jgi:hypothetical protein